MLRIGRLTECRLCDTHLHTSTHTPRPLDSAELRTLFVLLSTNETRLLVTPPIHHSDSDAGTEYKLRVSVPLHSARSHLTVYLDASFELSRVAESDRALDVDWVGSLAHSVYTDCVQAVVGMVQSQIQSQSKQNEDEDEAD